MKKLKIPDEVAYLLSCLLLSLAVAMLTAADFGVSMVVAPAYILSEAVSFLTFGQSEYIVQGLLFVAFCVLMKKVKVAYFGSFVTCLLYGAMLDAWRAFVPLFNPDITPPGSMDLPVRLVLFAVGMALTSFAVAVSFHPYLYPQVYDFFVKGISLRFGVERAKFKTAFDVACLVTACAMTLLLFRRFVGIGVGTLIMTAANGWLIGIFSRLLERYTELTPLAPKLSRCFDLQG